MRVRHSGLLLGLLVGLQGLSAAATREVIGREGPRWMQPPRAVGRQAIQATPDRNITQSARDDRDPVWSADGTLIAFASNRAGGYDIYLCRPDGSHPDTGAALTPKLFSGQPGDERYPAFSPGGTELAYIRGGAIYLRNLRSGVESLVASNLGQPTGLAFNFDGQRLAFSTQIAANGDVRPNLYWISLNANNRSLTRITETPYNDLAPSWFPRSDRIIFASDRNGDLDIFEVAVPGPATDGTVGDGVPEAQHTLLVGGLGNQTEPAWVNRGGITLDPTFDQAYHIVYADDGGLTDYNIKLADADGAPTDVAVYDDSGTVAADQTEPFANPIQNASTALVVYAGRQLGNWELYVANVFDGSAPILSDGVTTALPTVTPRQTFPGATVTIEAPVYDAGSGVAEVWGLIRMAEKPTFQRSQNTTNRGSGVLNNNDLVVGNLNHEFDQWLLDASGVGQYGAVDPRLNDPTELQLITLVRGAPFGQPANEDVGIGLRFRNDGVPPDRDGTDNIWTATFTTPAEAQDFYLDIVPFDTRGNVPIDTDLSTTRPPFTGNNPLSALITPGFRYYALGYDHVAGFTTRSLDLTRKVLFVSDYACGQKFQVADFAGNDAAVLTRYWPAAVPVEHYWFTSDDLNRGITVNSTTPNTGMAGMPMFFRAGTSPPNVDAIANPYYRDAVYGRFFPFAAQQVDLDGLHTGDPAMAENPEDPTNAADPGSFPFGGSAVSDPKAVWRVLCRGPVDAATLNAYTPLPLPQPSGSPIPAQHADRMVIWCSPYTGDLFVQPGTLLDADVQNSLAGFVAAGGRLFVTGQDIGWALTKNGSQANTFMTGVLRSQYNSDASADVQDQVTPQSFLRRELTPGQSLQGTELQLFQVVDNPVTSRLYSGYSRWVEPDGSEDLPEEQTIRLNTGSGAGWQGDGAANQWFIDDVLPTGGGISTLTYAAGGQTAMVRYIDATTGSRMVYAAFGFEAIRNGYSYRADYAGSQTDFIIGHEHKVEMLTNISDYLRTGGLLGKVVGPDGATPMGGITVNARLGTQATGAIMATTTTLADGTYLLRGLSTANYSVWVESTEFIADHRPFERVQGGMIVQSSDLTIRLLRFDTGSVVGTVTDTSGAPVGSATVTATLQTTGTGPYTPTPVQTDTNGGYVLNLPGGTYTVTASAPGYGSGSQADVLVVAGDIVPVNLVLQPAPGTLRGTITGGGNPLTGATVSILRQGVVTATAVTSATGAFSVALAAGTYDLQVTAAGFQQGGLTGLQVLSDQETVVTLDLTAVPPGSLAGVITLTGSNQPVAGVQVSLVAGGLTVAATTSAGNLTTQNGATYNYLFSNVPAGTYDVQIEAQGFSSATRANQQVLSGRLTSGVNFELQPLHTFVAGLSMTSTPFDYQAAAPDIQTLLDDDANPATRLRLATWDTVGQQYMYYPTAPANTFRLGRGYFMRLGANVPLTVQGVRAPIQGVGYDIALSAGWNLIGHVYEFPVDLFACQVIYQGTTYSLQQAAAQGLVNASLYTLNFNQYQQVFRLDAYTGYWLRAFQNVSLRIPPTALRSVGEPGRQARVAATSDSWRAEIVARSTSGLTARATFGMDTQSGDVYDAHDRAAPPAPPVSGYLELAFPHADWGRFSDRYGTDVRSRRPTAEWLLEARCDRAGEELELTWPGLGAALPAGVAVVLEDLTTGQKRSLRSTSGYRWTAGEAGETRQFKLTVAPAGTRATIAAVGFAPGRGGGGRLSYTLTAPLTMSVEVRGVGGSLVKRLVRGESRAEGTWTEVWDGRDEQGRPLPGGTYTIVLVGVGEAGEQVREVRTILHRR